MAKLGVVTGQRDAGYPVQVQLPGRVNAIARQPDGKLVIGGDFWFAGGLPRRNLARVNSDGILDATWLPTVQGQVNAIAINETNIYLGGFFDHVGSEPRSSLAKLNSTLTDAVEPEWNPNIDGVVYSLALSGTNLFAGGTFCFADCSQYDLAKFDAFGTGNPDTNWVANVDGAVYAMSMSGEQLFVGGQFSRIGGQDRRGGLAKVSTASPLLVDAAWNPDALGVVTAIAVSDTNMFVGGFFEKIGCLTNTYLAKLDPSGSGTVDSIWNPNPGNGGNNIYITALSVEGTNLYVGGYFNVIGGQLRGNLAKLSTFGTGAADESWSYDARPTQVEPLRMLALLVNGDDVYVGGSFDQIGGESRYGLALLALAEAPSMIQGSNSTVIVTRNPGDGLEVTHFQITGIAGGTLFHSDGITPINVGDFITAEQGGAGLNFVGTGTNGSVTAVSALNDTQAGAGSAATTLDFSVNHRPVFRFSSASYSVREDMMGSLVTLTVKKLRPGAASVSFALQPGSAVPYDPETGSGDYAALSRSPLTFTTSETSKNIPIFIYNDDLVEGDETFSVTLTGASDGALLAYPATATVTIIDDECLGQHGSFTNTALPAAVPLATGALRVDISSPATAQWRLAGDPVWRSPGSTAVGLVAGHYEVLFKPVLGYRVPEKITVQIFAGITTSFSALYESEATNSYGDFSVTLKPDEVATNPELSARGQWRISGGEWQDSGVRLHLVVGPYVIEFKSLTNWSAPRTTVGLVVANEPLIKSAAYEPESAAGPALPSVLPVNVVTSTPPYLYNGLIETEDGFGSGVVVKERVVLTAAHVLFDDTLLSYAKRVKWFLQKHKGDYEPVGQVPRGWYIFDGYAAQRTYDLGAGGSPGISTRDSQNFDAAAMYFVEITAPNPDPNLPGRGGYGGCLASDLAINEWLTSSRLKMLVGYPLEGIAETNQGKMHATTPTNLRFTKPYPQILNQVYATTDIASRPGNSGGPVYVQADDGNYYPAAIYLGGGSQTLVRAIDDKVICLINAAEISGNGGGNNNGGGVALWSPGLTTSPFISGLFRVNFVPTDVVAKSAGWRVKGGDDPTWISSTNLYYPLIPGPFDIEFKSIAGYSAPPIRRVEVVVEYTTPVDAFYSLISLSSPRKLPGGSFQMTLGGGTGRVYSIQWSRELVNWSNLVTLTNLAGPTNVMDTQATNFDRRFYRAVEW
jgi:hypothetical protein